MRGALLSIAAATALASISAPAAASTKSPMVVELFTAQGCAACVKANPIVNALADRKGLVLLTFPVDYLDYIGWKDTYAEPQFTDRQRAYTSRFKVREIYAPELVVDGRKEMLGLDRDGIDDLLRSEAAAPRDGPSLYLNRKKTRLEVGEAAAPDHAAEVWLVRYDPREQQVHVKGGDNKGKVIVLRNVVRELTRLGAWRGRQHDYAVPPASDNDLRTVFLVQTAKGGRILAAMKD